MPHPGGEDFVFDELDFAFSEFHFVSPEFRFAKSESFILYIFCQW